MMLVVIKIFCKKTRFSYVVVYRRKKLAFSFRRKLKEGKPLIGTIQTLSALEITEIFTVAGFDWLFIDMEHTVLDVPAVQRILQTAQGRIAGIVRVPAGEEVWVKRVLDAGAEGLIFPQVNSAGQAKKIVQLCKYSPEGNRGVGISRAQGYGMRFNEYVETANRDTAVIIQIEHIEAVKNIEAIVQVPGIDAIFIGPYDLSGSMGKIGKVADPEVQEKIKIALTAGLKAGLAVGIFTLNPADVKRFIEKGYTLLTLGIDVMFFSGAARQALREVKGS
jgi:2-dehydro-3-deoxyglucarate aldolase/4-hydroxy-2-oxoheptanedioate aldolase